MAAKAETMAYLYLLRSNTVVLPRYEDKLNKELKALRRNLQDTVSTALKQKVEVVDIIRTPENLQTDDESQEPTVAALQIKAVGAIDFLVNKDRINLPVKAEAQQKTYLMKINNKLCNSATLELNAVDFEYLRNPSDLFEKLTQLLNLKISSSSKCCVSGGWSEISIFRGIIIEQLKFSEQTVTILPGIKTANLETNLATNLLLNGKLGNTETRYKEEIREVYEWNLGLFLLTTALHSDVYKNIYATLYLKADYDENIAKIQIRGDKFNKSKIAQFAERLGKKYQQTLQNYKSVSLPNDLPQKYKTWLHKMLMPGTNPDLVIVVGEYKFVTMVYHTDKAKQASDFLQEYMDINQPGPFWLTDMFRQKNDVAYEKAEQIKSQPKLLFSTPKPNAKPTEFRGVFKRGNDTLAFYEKQKEKISAESGELKLADISPEQDKNQLLLRAYKEDELVHTLEILDFSYESYKRYEAAIAVKKSQEKKSALNTPENESKNIAKKEMPKLALVKPATEERRLIARTDRAKDGVRVFTSREDTPACRKSQENNDIHKSIKQNNADDIMSTDGQNNQRFKKGHNLSNDDHGDTRQESGPASPHQKASSSNIKPDEKKPKEDTGGTVFIYGGYGKNTLITVGKQDITTMQIDAIVNAANEEMDHAGGIAKAIADAAGEKLNEECESIIIKDGNIATGECCITNSGDLPCKKVIHTVGPIWDDYPEDESKKLLFNAFYSSMICAYKNRCTSIAIPAISSGIFGAPMKEVSQCAVNAIMRFLQGPYSTYMESIHLVDIHDSTLQQFVTDLKKIKELKVIEEQ